MLLHTCPTKISTGILSELVMEMSSKMEGVPLADTFTVETKVPLQFAWKAASAQFLILLVAVANERGVSWSNARSWFCPGGFQEEGVWPLM
jgi:hypothetical protein